MLSTKFTIMEILMLMHTLGILLEEFTLKVRLLDKLLLLALIQPKLVEEAPTPRHSLL